MFIQTTSQLPSVQNDVLTGQYAGLRLYSCNCNTVHFRYVHFFRTMFFSYFLFIPPFNIIVYYYYYDFFLRFLFIPISLLFCALPCTVSLSLSLSLSLSISLSLISSFHQETTAACILLFLMDREIYHTLCIVYYNNHYV